MEFMVHIILGLFVTVQTADGYNTPRKSLKGKYQVVGLLSIHSHNIEQFDTAAFLNHLAMQTYAEYKQILQYTTYDVLNSTELLMEKISNFYLDRRFRLKRKKYTSNIVAVIGYMKYEMTKIAINLLLPMQVPFITYKENSLIDHGFYPWYLPMYEQSMESLHVERFIKHFNWTYIALISLNANDPKWNVYFEESFSLLTKTFKSLYFVSESMYAYNESRMLDMISNIKLQPSIKVIFIWGNGRNQITFLNLAAKYNLTNQTWIGHEDVWNSMIYLEEKLLNGLLIVRNDYFRLIKSNLLSPQQLTIGPNSSVYSEQFLMKHNINISKHIQQFYVNYLTNKQTKLLTHVSRAAYIIRYHARFKYKLGVFDIRKELYKNISNAIQIANIDTSKLRKKFTIPNLPLFTKYIDTTNIPQSIKWHNSMNLAPITTVPELTCKSGWEPRIDYFLPNQTQWEISYGQTCRKCAKGYYKANGGYHNCTRCDTNTIPSLNRTYCFDPYTDLYLTLSYSGAILSLTFSIVGIIIMIVILSVFITFKETPIVKTSDLSPSVVQLLTFLFIFIILPVTALTKPSKIICMSRPIIFGILTTINIATVLSRTQKILKAFQSNGRLSRRQISLLSAEQCLIIFILFVIDVSILVVSFTMNKLQTIIVVLDKRNQIRINMCNTDTHLHIQVIFAILLLFTCLFQAFRGRNLPEKFNDAKYIVYSTFITSLCYLILFPLYYNRYDQFKKTIINWLVLTIANCSFLLMLYSQKTYLILFRPQLNTVKEFQANIMEKVRNNNKQRESKQK